jgi:hypothetical protein
VHRLVPIALAFAIPMAALGAPLVHAHPDDHDTAHHRARAVHTHWTGHGDSSAPSESPSLGTEDHDRAVFFGAFVAVATATIHTPAVVPTAFVLPVPVERAAHPAVEVAHGLDPPFLPLPSRAPPAFLS